MRTNFKVLVKAADLQLGPGELEVHVTRNGYQWQVVTLMPDEAMKVAEAIQIHVSTAVVETNL